MATKPEIIFDEATHTYLVNGVEVPSVTEILAPLHRGYDKINPSVLEYAAQRGRAVHEALELIDYGADAEVTPETVGYIIAYQEWLQIYKPSWVMVEQIVWHEVFPKDVDRPMLEDGNDADYIGTLDRLGFLNGKEEAVIDIKTSQPTKEALVSVCCQTAAYADAVYDFDKPSRYGLFLKPDGSFRFVDCKAYEQKYNFSGMSLFYNILRTREMIDEVLETKARGK